MSDVYTPEADSLASQRASLPQYKGKVLLIMNTAGKCGFTPQYAGPEVVYKRLHDKGLEVFDFPRNQFGKQEPGGVDEVGAFYEKNYDVSFPAFGKIDVDGSSAHPLYKQLTLGRPGVLGIGVIKWDFTKFLLHRDGTVYKRYAPLAKPEEIADDIKWLLTELDPT